MASNEQAHRSPPSTRFVADHDAAIEVAFVLCLVGVTFKQLRIGGVASVFDAGLVLIALLFVVRGMSQIPRMSARIFAGFLLIAVPAGLSTLVALNDGLTIALAREIAAYGVSFVVALAFVLRFRGRVGWFISLFLLVLCSYFSVVLLLAFLPNPFQDAMWYWGQKLQGLSDNPNQLSLLSIVAVSLLIMRGCSARGLRSEDYLGALIVGVVAALAESAAFLLALAFTSLLVGCWSVITFVRWWATRDSDRDGRAKATASLSRALRVTMLVALVSCISAVPILPTIFDKVGLDVSFFSPGSNAAATSGLPRPDTLTAGGLPTTVAPSDRSEESVIDGLARVATVVSEMESGQGSVRLLLWSKALSTAREAPLLGRGPGARLIVRSDLPPMEAHNTYVDVLVTSGVLGLGGFVILIGSVFVVAKGQRHLFAVMLVATPVLAFIAFHFVGRQPLFWIWVTTLAFYAQSSLASQTAGASDRLAS